MIARQFLVSIRPNSRDESPSEVGVVTEGKTAYMDVRCPWLVSSGQTVPLKVIVSSVEADEPGDGLIDARHVIRYGREGGILVDRMHDCRWMPSQEPLYRILARVVQHQVDAPTHGADCVCMDAFAYEIRRHIDRALPDKAHETYTNTAEWEKSFMERLRIKHVLRMASNGL